MSLSKQHKMVEGIWRGAMQFCLESGTLVTNFIIIFFRENFVFLVFKEKKNIYSGANQNAASDEAMGLQMETQLESQFKRTKSWGL